MKTTVDIVDALLSDARRLAAEHGTTVRALIEEGLRHVVADRMERSGFELRRATFGGRGVRPEIREGSWERVRELIYDDRQT